MCKKTKYHKTSNTQIDKCMRPLIKYLKKEGRNTVACCCGHGRYPMTIVVGRETSVVRTRRIPFNITEVITLWFEEILSGKVIPRKRRFYLKDKQGYYYIPEVIE